MKRFILVKTIELQHESGTYFIFLPSVAGKSYQMSRIFYALAGVYLHPLVILYLSNVLLREYHISLLIPRTVYWFFDFQDNCLIGSGVFHSVCVGGGGGGLIQDCPNKERLST